LPVYPSSSIVPCLTKLPASRFQSFLAFLFLASTTLACTPAAGASFAAVVTHVVDGDKLVAVGDDHQTYLVRLAAVEAPSGRPYSDRAAEALRKIALDQRVSVIWHREDRAHNRVAMVFVGKRDVGLTQIRAGLARHDAGADRDQLPRNRRAYARAESEARRLRLGMWHAHAN
jgi:endonuclease YncB( thermonuclease family)